MTLALRFLGPGGTITIAAIPLVERWRQCKRRSKVSSMRKFHSDQLRGNGKSGEEASREALGPRRSSRDIASTSRRGNRFFSCGWSLSHQVRGPPAWIPSCTRNLPPSRERHVLRCLCISWQLMRPQARVCTTRRSAPLSPHILEGAGSVQCEAHSMPSLA